MLYHIYLWFYLGLTMTTEVALGFWLLRLIAEIKKIFLHFYKFDVLPFAIQLKALRAILAFSSALLVLSIILL